MTVKGTDQEQYNHNPNESNNPDEHKDCLNLKLKAIFYTSKEINSTLEDSTRGI